MFRLNSTLILRLLCSASTASCWLASERLLWTATVGGGNRAALVGPSLAKIFARRQVGRSSACTNSAAEWSVTLEAVTSACSSSALHCAHGAWPQYAGAGVVVNLGGTGVVLPVCSAAVAVVAAVAGAGSNDRAALHSDRPCGRGRGLAAG